ncbi:MAG TPA: protein kinase [Gemmatimonadales bacterium]|nr:protein kinase [Gemmatimonadales bacterium]
MTFEAVSPARLRSALGDRYDIERQIGAGGMATVYLATDRKHQRPVAVKVLRAELAASVGADRFLREIGIAAKLAHPHLLPLIDSGNAAGWLYYVTPYVPGGSLRERLEREGRLPVADVVRLAQEVGAGLDYAHRSGFVHRDVKPENVLFADGQAVLADFGIARASRASGPDIVTGGGIAVGTPEYMSPEQASGESHLGPASDLYSLSCVLYESLTGRPPIEGDNARTTLARQVTEQPMPLRALRPDTPSAIDRAIARGLAKNPAERFASVAEFVAALTAPSPGEGGALVIGARSVAVLPFVNVSPDRDNEYLSDGITDELIDALAKIDGLRVASRTSVFALKGKPQDVRAIGAALGAAVVLEGTVRQAGDRLRITAQLTSTDDGRLLWSQRYDRHGSDVFAIQDDIARTIVETLRASWFAEFAEPSSRRGTTSVAAYGLYLRGRYAWNTRTQEGVSEAIRYFKEAIAADPRYAQAYAGLADAYALHVDYRSVPVHEGLEKAKAYAREALALDDSVAEAHASLAWSLFIYDWDWEAAEREFRRAIECDPRYATGHNWHAFLLAAQGRFADALVAGHTALELDPASVSIRRTLGWLYYYARRYPEAQYHLTRAIAMNPLAEESYRILGLTLVYLGRLDEAVRVLRESAALPGAGAYATATLGYALAMAGKRTEAEAMLGDLIESGKHGYVSPVALATVYVGLGDKTRALDYAEQARDERRGWIAYLRVNPILDPLRGDPRFQALVASIRPTGS